MLTVELVAFFFDDDEAVFDSEELMLEEEESISESGDDDLSSPQAANKIDATSTKNFFKVFSLFELFPSQI
jgi:hypothetical protein